MESDCGIAFIILQIREKSNREDDFYEKKVCLAWEADPKKNQRMLDGYLVTVIYAMGTPTMMEEA